jgi:hypothetical protein
MEGKKLNNSEALNFILAGNSTSTFLNRETDNRFTYKVKKSKDSDLFFVSVLTSPDVYTYIGYITNDFKLGKKSKISKDAQSVKVFNYIFRKLKSGNLPEQIEIWHNGKCGKCARKLTVPSSIDTGIGPECFKNLSKTDKRDIILKKILG